jgi:hypothetical protein
MATAKRKPGKKERRLREIAAELHKVKDSLPGSTLEDSISLCSYVARQFGDELTLDEVSQVEDFMYQLENADKLAAASIKAITVIDCTDAENFEVQHARSFNDDPEGEAAARATFGEWVHDAQAEGEDKLPDRELDQLFAVGKYEVGEGYIAVIHST